MNYKPSDSFYAEFTTSNPSTGAALNADSLPVATAQQNGTDDGAFTLTVTNVDTGRYKITGTVPSGYAAGDTVVITVAATVSSVAAKAVVCSFLVDSRRVGEVYSTIGANGAALTAIGDTRLDYLDAAITSRSDYDGGAVTLDLSQAVATSNTANTVGDCLNAARAGAFGKEVKDGTAYTIYAPDGTTVVRSFTLDNSDNPTSRI